MSPSMIGCTIAVVAGLFGLSAALPAPVPGHHYGLPSPCNLLVNCTRNANATYAACIKRALAESDPITQNCIVIGLEDHRTLNQKFIDSCIPEDARPSAFITLVAIAYCGQELIEDVIECIPRIPVLPPHKPSSHYPSEYPPAQDYPQTDYGSVYPALVYPAADYPVPPYQPPTYPVSGYPPPVVPSYPPVAPVYPPVAPVYPPPPPVYQPTTAAYSPPVEPAYPPTAPPSPPVYKPQPKPAPVYTRPSGN